MASNRVQESSKMKNHLAIKIKKKIDKKNLNPLTNIFPGLPNKGSISFMLNLTRNCNVEQIKLVFVFLSLEASTSV